MNTMKLPGFTAEASLYKTTGRYQTGSPAFTSVTKAIGTLHPAAEVIEIYGCPPGTIPWIEGETAVCILTEPSWGGGEQSPGGNGGFGDTEPYGGGGGKLPRKTKGRPESKPKPPKWTSSACTAEHYKTEKAQQCIKRTEEDMAAGKDAAHTHRTVCGEELSEVLCCIKPGKGPLICDVQQV